MNDLGRKGRNTTPSYMNNCHLNIVTLTQNNMTLYNNATKYNLQYAFIVRTIVSTKLQPSSNVL